MIYEFTATNPSPSQHKSILRYEEQGLVCYEGEGPQI